MLGGAMGKNINDIKECREKIKNIYTVIKKLPNIKKVVFVTRGPKYMYGLGFGVIDGSKFIEYYIDRDNWKQKEQFIHNIDKTLKFFNDQNFKTYYLIEDPELGFSPKNCMERPFGIFTRECKLPLLSYLKRAGEYRRNIYKIAKKYNNITILDPKNLYCYNEFCYTFRNGKMLYADDDHHSVDGSIMQAEYFEKRIFSGK